MDVSTAPSHDVFLLSCKIKDLALKLDRTVRRSKNGASLHQLAASVTGIATPLDAEREAERLRVTFMVGETAVD
jgi:hypothetical protein